MKLEILVEAIRPRGMFHCSENPSLNKTGFSEPLNIRELGEYDIGVAYRIIAPEAPEASQSEMMDRINKWSNGQATGIWVSDYPATMYGSNCYKVKIPKNAILVMNLPTSHYTSGYNHTKTSIDVEYKYYLCRGSIPSKNFRPVSDKYLDAWEVTSKG